MTFRKTANVTKPVQGPSLSWDS